MNEPASPQDRLFADLEGHGRPYGIPYEDPDSGVWLIRVAMRTVRPATVKEVERELARQEAGERKISKSNQEASN